MVNDARIRDAVEQRADLWHRATSAHPYSKRLNLRKMAYEATLYLIKVLAEELTDRRPEVRRLLRFNGEVYVLYRAKDDVYRYCRLNQGVDRSICLDFTTLEDRIRQQLLTMQEVYSELELIEKGILEEDD